MRKSILTFLAFLSALVLTSSTTRTFKVSAVNRDACPGPLEIYLVMVGTEKELYPGEDELDPNEVYYVHVIGGANSMIVCVTGGLGYTVNGTGCTDLGSGQDGIPGTITTNSNISSGVTIGIGVHCTPGNNDWTGDFYY